MWGYVKVKKLRAETALFRFRVITANVPYTTLNQKNKLVFVLFLNCLCNYTKAYKAFEVHWPIMIFPSTVTKLGEAVFHTLYFISIPLNEAILLKFVKHWKGAVTLLCHFALQSTSWFLTNYSHGSPLKKLPSI